MAVEGSTRKSMYHEEPTERRSSRFTGPSFSDRKSRGEAETVLITAAEASFEEQHKARVRRYSILMAFRIPALVVAAIVFSTTGLWWISLLVVAASIPLPWMAVLIANDRPPRSSEEVNRYTWGDRDLEQPAISASPRNVIEG